MATAVGCSASMLIERRKVIVVAVVEGGMPCANGSLNLRNLGAYYRVSHQLWPFFHGQTRGIESRKSYSKVMVMHFSSSYIVPIHSTTESLTFSECGARRSLVATTSISTTIATSLPLSLLLVTVIVTDLHALDSIGLALRASAIAGSVARLIRWGVTGVLLLVPLFFV
jgi:hypothetical protein